MWTAITHVFTIFRPLAVSACQRVHPPIHPEMLANDATGWKQEDEVLASTTGALRASALSLLDKMSSLPSRPADGGGDSEEPSWRRPSFLLRWRESSSSRHSGRSVGSLPSSLRGGHSGGSSQALHPQVPVPGEAEQHMQFLRDKVHALQDLVSRSGQDAARLDVALRISLLSQVCKSQQRLE